MPIRFLAASLVAVIVCVVQAFPVACLAQDRPTGKVTMEFGQGGFLVSASGGRGTLHFKGRSYPFKLGSLGAGGFGVSKVKATGEVYNLRRIEDFPGGYFQVRAGYAAGKGTGVLRLKNSKGVLLKLRTATKGLALHLGADGLKIEMAPATKN